jgi:biotin operon repressor/anti-sigma regulatory factor (Ser/Thr protein kinase)
MDTKQAVLDYILSHGSASGTNIAQHLGISRQAVNKHIQKLVKEGALAKKGKTKGAVYLPASSEEIQKKEFQFEKTYSLNGLEEDRVFEEINILLNLSSELNRNVFDIFRYAFTEILNNAIEHSESASARITVNSNNYTINFIVRDFGVGIFAKVKQQYDLADEYSSIGEILKGKKTTMPNRHSGEGLFFTTKIGDHVVIKSHKIFISFINTKHDLYTGEISRLRGTQVEFTIKKRAKKELYSLFNQYAPEEFDYQFAKSEVYVKLFQKDYVSRSEGRRLVSGLSGFRVVVLDFKGVTSIGQAFADEIFRVFQKRNPHLEIQIKHANQAILQMIKHVSVDN